MSEARVTFGGKMSLLPVWHKGLTPDLRGVAEKLLGETSDVKAKALVTFRRLINEQQDIYSRLDEVFLLRFLRTKKYNVPKALKLFVNYYHFRSRQLGVFTGRRPSDLRAVIDMRCILYAPFRAPNGSHVAVFRVGHFDVSQGSAQDLFSAGIMAGEMILDCEATQVCGGMLVIDLAGMTLQHYRQFASTQFISLCISLIQDTLPERVKSIHVVNESFTIHTIFSLLKPLLKKKIRERLHFYGHDIKRLHEDVPKSHLPESLGGTLGPKAFKDFAKYFFSQESFIERINKYGVLEKMKSNGS